MFQCNRCKKSFQYHSDYDRHTKRKFPCKIISIEYDNGDNNNDEEDEINNYVNSPESSEKEIMEYDGDTYSCQYCNKSFSRKFNLKRHLAHSCQAKHELDKNERKKLSDEIEKLKSSNMLKRKPITINNNINTFNTINSNNNNHTINIQLVAFGKEDRAKLTNKEILKILNKGYYSIPELLKVIHFDENKPENHNIYISNDRSSVVHIFDGEQWNAVDRNETIRNLFDDGRNFLLTKVEEFNEREKPLTDRAKKMVLKFERFDNDIDEYPIKKKEILAAIRNMLYNNKDLAIDARKQFNDSKKINDTIEYIMYLED